MIPDDVLTKTLEIINKTPVSYNYFFNTINNPAWLTPLKEKGFFKNPTPAIRKDGYIQFPVWPESGYLMRVADKADDEVLEIIKSLPETDNERVMDDIVNALLKIDATKVFRQTELVKKYVNTSRFLLLHQNASEFVCKLAEAGYDKPALGLAKEMLDVTEDPEKEEKLKSNYIMLKAITKYRDYDYKTIADKITPSLAKAAPVATVSMYADLLQKAIDYEQTYFRENDDEEVVLEEKKHDLSYIWRPKIAVENNHSHDPEDVLTTALRDSLAVLMKDSSISDGDKLAKLQELAANKYSVFKRLVEFTLRDFKDNVTFKPLYDSVIQDEQVKHALAVEESGVGEITSGFVTEKPTEVLKDLPDNELIKTLRTYKDESGWSFERDSLAKELSSLIKIDPERFIPLLEDISSTKYEYFNEAIQAFEEIADSLSEDLIIQILSCLIEIFDKEDHDEKNERYDYYMWSRSSAVRLIEKLLSQKEDKTERITTNSLETARKLLLLLCRGGDPVSEDEANFEPADLSINSTRGKAMHAIAYLLAFMNRNKVAKTAYNPIFDELDWHLQPENDASPAIRSVYGWRFELLYGTNKQWADSNIKNIFTDDDLGKVAFDSYVRFNRVHADELEILGDVFEKQLPRLVMPPVDDGKSRHDAMENFVQRLALHYMYHTLDLSNQSLMSTLLSTADVKYIKELANFIGFRLYKKEGDEPTDKELSKLKELWEAIVKLTQEDVSKTEALEEVGTWFASGKFDPEWSLNQLTYAASKVDDIHLDFAALERLETLSAEYPAESIKALSNMVDNAKERWAVSSWSKNATTIIQTAYTSSDEAIKESAKSLANKLVARGYIEYRNIINSEQTNE